MTEKQSLYHPPEMWDTKPKQGKYLVFVNSKLSSIAITVNPSQRVDDRFAVLAGDVWLRVTLKMVGWLCAKEDLMFDLGNRGQITQPQYEAFERRMDTLRQWVKESESFSEADIDWAWDNRQLQSKFKPPFTHYREKYVKGGEKR